MGSQAHRSHVCFFPMMAHGHMIPLVDIAKLFASRNLKSTIITTPLNQPLVSKQIENTKSLGFDIEIQVIKFPTIEETGLPEGCEHADFITSKNLGWEMVDKFLSATILLREPVEKFLREIRPDCLVADMFYPWATDSASKFGIPRLVFHGTCSFSLCILIYVEQYEPQKELSSDSGSVIIPNLPREIKLSRKQMPSSDRTDSENETLKLFKLSRESELKSFGVIFNSFYEIESAYADHYKNVLGRRAWHIGPVSVCNRDVEDKAQRGKKPSIDEHECLKWLNSKKPNSVVYLCFGSISNFKASQLKEIALGLESSGQQFIWVVRRNKNPEEDDEDWLPEGFKERIEGKGMIIQGWAPQLLILDHGAVGGFVTHCGWNSTLEGIAAGKPMVTWPVGGEQFYNEKLVTEMLKIGVSVGVEEWTLYGDSIVKSESLEKAVNRIMEGEEAEEMRKNAQTLALMARKAIEEGGSSYSELSALLDELKLNHK